MYYLINEKTLKTSKPEFVTGGLGVDVEMQSQRYVTYEIEKALKFETIKEAQKVQSLNFVIAERKADGLFKRID